MSVVATPIGDRVLILPIEVESVTPGGIYIPDAAKEKSQRGRVVAIGDGRWDNGTLVEPSVKEGDEVYYSKYAGTDVTIDGENYVVLRENDILLIL